MDPIWRFFNKRSTEKHRVKLMKKAKKAMKIEGLVFEKFLGQGAFGDVVKVKEIGSGRKLAVKIINKAMTWEGEVNIWKGLKNPNVLPLEKIISLPNMDLFVMPLHKKSLNKIVQEKKFKKNPDAFNLTIKWLSEVANALKFMHGEGLAHLDLKCDNVLISKEMEAILCDFSCLNVTGVNLERYGLTAYYKPPEANRNRSRGPEVEGASFDVWSFGLLGLYLWTGGWFESQVGSVQSWTYNVYPLLFQVLQPEFFQTLIRKTFPESSVSKEDVDLALNLVQCTLRYQRGDRPSIGCILDHGLWSRNCEKTLTPDPMWIHKNKFTECPNPEKADTIRNMSPPEEADPIPNMSPPEEADPIPNMSPPEEADPIPNMSPPEEASRDARSAPPRSVTFAAPVLSTENIEDPFKKIEGIEDFANFSEAFGDTAVKAVEWTSEYNWELDRGDQENPSEQLVENSDFKIEAEGVVEIQNPTPHPFEPETPPEGNEERLSETAQEAPLAQIRNFILRQWRRINPRSGRRKLK